MTQILDWKVTLAEPVGGPVLVGRDAEFENIALEDFPNLKGVCLAVKAVNESSPIEFSVSIEFGDDRKSVGFYYSQKTHKKLRAQTVGDWTYIPLEGRGIETPNEFRVWVNHSRRVKSFNAVRKGLA